MHPSEFPETMMRRDVRCLVYGCRPELHDEKRQYVFRNAEYWGTDLVQQDADDDE